MTRPVEEELAQLRGLVDELAQRFLVLDGLIDRPPNWRKMSAEDADEAWNLLTDWTDWLTGRYQLGEIVPACWWAHPAMLEELSALHAAWCGAYTSAGAKAADGVLWHDMLERVLGRISELDRTGCASAATHRNEIEPALPGPSVLSDREDAIDADIATRPERMPSQPPTGDGDTA